MKKVISMIFLISIIMISGVSSDVGTTSKINKRKILYFQSYNNVFNGLSSKQKGELSKVLGNEFEVRSISIPSDRITDINSEEKIYNTLRMYTIDYNKYDSIVVNGDRALEFILKFKEDTFKDIPIVFFGIRDKNLENKALKYNLVSGIRSSDLLKPNIDLVIENHKNVKNIHIISNSKKDLNDENIIDIKNKYMNMGVNINIIETSTMSLKDFSNIVSSFNENDAIIKVAPGDFNDSFLNISDFTALLNSLCKDIPVYSVTGFGIENGAVGGKVMSDYMNIQASTKIVDYIVENKPNKSIDVNQSQISVHVFEINALKKFNINKSQLPKGSYILNSFKDIMFRHEGIMNKVILIGICIFILILFMICYIIHKQKYENALKNVLKESKNLNKFKSHLISNVSHELRTPLNVIISSVQLLRYKSKNSKELTESTFDIIDNNCNRLLRITNNLIDIDKYEYGELNLKLENINIVNLIENLVISTSPLASSKNLHLVFDTNDEVINMAVDIDKIERVVLNLISNAIKFSKSNEDININLIKDKNRLKIIVADKGIGISEKNLSKIFKRFSQIDTSLTRKNEGSGIGLAIVDSFVKSHNGTITVKSKLNEGTEFIVDLPIFTLDKNIKEYGNSNSLYNANLELSDIYL
ncbi:sensor histidine kinase [[Clostridium] dakarense]|uniref:sensor histidine kinase n=1 Tax=Faecalimicrobium dakarense TaxID=1301100 RepID=UPI0004B08C2E|nr:ATP-binding protein [[Clostridium] dakarense]